MKKYLLTYSTIGSNNDRPDALDRTFDTIPEAKAWVKDNEYGTEFEYHVWEQTVGFRVQCDISILETPPILTRTGGDI